MNIIRIDAYCDSRFSQKALFQHGCFFVDEEPYEFEIISDSEAILRGKDPLCFGELIDEFRFYSPHITRFVDKNNSLIQEFPPVNIVSVPLNKIQPSQFYADADKVAAIETFIHAPHDIIIQVLPFSERYISLDGHTRLYLAATRGWRSVRAVVDTSDEWVFRFVEEAQKRGVYSPNDLVLLSHEEYEDKWNRFCDELFAR